MSTTASYLDGYTRTRERDVRAAAESARISEEYHTPQTRRSLRHLMGNRLLVFGMYLLRDDPTPHRLHRAA